VDLNGHTPGQQPASPAGALAALLAADGVDACSLPPGLDGRAAMWRDRMAGKRVLLILDNAAGSDQVAPLLPGAADCLVLVTSRRYLGDLPSAAVSLTLDTPPAGEAAQMFLRVAPRAAGEPAEVAELVALCGYLPLAISLLARLFTRHRSWTMADLIGETKLKLLTVTAEDRTVAAAFGLSYDNLTAARQRFFRLLSLHPGADIDPYAAAALTGLTPGEAEGHLDGLHSVRLIAEPVYRRYRMHDLIRDYARCLAAAGTAGECGQAASRLFDYYQHTAQLAAIHLARRTRPAATPAVQVPPAAPDLPGRDQARAWLSAEHANMLACADYAITHHQDARVAGLAAAIATHLRSDGPWTQAITLHTAAAAAACRLGDRPGEASALTELGIVRQLTGDYPGSAAALELALAIYRDLGERSGEASALSYLGLVRYVTGDHPGAVAALQRSLGISRDLGEQSGEASALTGLGAVRYLTGDYAAAAQALDLALIIYRDLGNRLGEANTLGELGNVRYLTGDHPGAAQALDQALIMHRDLGNRLGEANALCYLGAVRYLTGGHPCAAQALDQALAIYRDLGDRLGEAEALNRTGTLYLTCSDPQQACIRHQRALELARVTCSRLEEARALEGIGRSAEVMRNTSMASQSLRQALTIYRRIGAAEATCLTAEMSDLP
jgi:tetratricopeptide (TPR) repeat protein